MIMIKHPTMRLKRTSIGMTFDDLSAISGISKSHLNLIETGKRGLSYDNAIRIARCFNMKPDELFYNDEKLSLDMDEGN